MNRIDTSYFHLRYKLETLTSQYSSLGLLTSKELNRKLLKSIYPLDEVEGNLFTLAKEEIIDLYYSIPCKKCGQSSIFREDFNEDLSTIDYIRGNGEACSHCSSKISIPEGKVDKLYAVSHRLFERMGIREEETIEKEKTIWVRIKEFFS